MVIIGQLNLQTIECVSAAVSLRVVLDVAHVGNEAGQLVEADFVDVVAAHAIKEIGIFVDDVLVIEEELVRLQQLLLLHVQHVLLDVVAHDVVVLHVVVRDGLTAKHDQVVSVHHVQSNEPNAAISYSVQYDPGVALNVQLLDARSVATRFIADSVNEAAAKSATVRSPNRLL